MNNRTKVFSGLTISKGEWDDSIPEIETMDKATEINPVLPAFIRFGAYTSKAVEATGIFILPFIGKRNFNPKGPFPVINFGTNTSVLQ